jgi:Bacterial Ig domain/IPTL-CTERM motif
MARLVRPTAGGILDEHDKKDGTAGKDGSLVRAALTVPLPAVLVGLGLMASPPAQADGIAVDDHYSTPVDTALTRNVTNNDSIDANSSVQVFLIDPAPQHGTTVMQSNGSFTYTPATGFHGEDVFGYNLINGGNSAAEVFIDVGPSPVPGLGAAGVAGLTAALAALAMRRRRKS